MMVLKTKKNLHTKAKNRIFCSLLAFAIVLASSCFTVFAENDMVSDIISVNLRTDTTGASGNQTLISAESAGGKLPADKDKNEILGLGGNTEGRREYTVPGGGSKTFTLEASIYADGGARLAITEIYGGEVFTWNMDGSITIGNSYDSGRQPVEVLGHSYARGRWHKAAVTYDSAKQEFLLWCDGVALGSWRKVWGAEKMGFGMLPSDENGRALFDDVQYYEGTYRGAYTTPSLAVNSDDAHLDNGIIYYGDMATVSELAASVQTDAAYWNIYRDKSLETAAEGADGLASGMVLVLVSKNDVCLYYPIMQQQLSLEKVEFTGGTGMYGAKATLINGFKTPKSALMILVLKNADGEIEKVCASAVTTFEGKCEISIEPETAEADYKSEVFFLESWDNMTMIIDGIVKQ